jgi:sulfoxide reductase heme-binding subunit YedZ
LSLALVAPPSPLWYFARASGFVTLLLLTASVGLGIVVSRRGRSPKWPLFVTDGLHRYLSLVFLVFLSVHVLTIWLDPFTHFSLSDVLVPLSSNYRPLSMGLGIAAAELGLAIWITAYLRRWIGYWAWRAIHFLTYVVFALALIHGIATGTDTGSAWSLALYLGSAGVVGGLAWLRVTDTTDVAAMVTMDN